LTLPKTGTYTGPMPSSRWTRAARAAAVLVAMLPAGLRAQAVQRSMYVSVLNPDGTPARDLGPADFVVREDGVAREVLRVEPAADPIQLVVLVDNSTAAGQYTSDIRRALENFVATMTSAADPGARNELTLVTLASRPTVVAGATSSRADLLKGVGRVFAEQQTAAVLLDGIVEASRRLGKRDADRPVIVAIVTEGPEASWAHREAVLDAVRGSGAMFHAIVVGPFSSGMSEEDRDRNIVLEVGTKDTGGWLDHPLSGTALDLRLQRLAAELLQQYRVTYARPRSLIPPDRVTVSAAKAGLKARGLAIKEPRKDRP
jgi:hypothetical protein